MTNIHIQRERGGRERERASLVVHKVVRQPHVVSMNTKSPDVREVVTIPRQARIYPGL